MTLVVHQTARGAIDEAHEALVASRRPEDETRATWLRGLAEALREQSEELVQLAHEETHLPLARLRGEVVRTCFQAELFAERLESGTLLRRRIDPADAEWPMGARPDIRRGFVPIGVVLVFAASNFPFAFSVVGGDTVSALAAGCPVVVKAHEGHPRLSRRTADIARQALVKAGAPAGLLVLLEGQSAGSEAIDDPRVKAVGFTGSPHAGRLLFDRASRRPDPIPFYGELGSTNPVLVTPTAWAERAKEIAEGLVGSFTLGSGQFCTQPGVVLVPDVAALLERLQPPAVGPMLNERIERHFEEALASLADRPGVQTALTGVEAPGAPSARVLTTDAAAVRADPSLLTTEVFGPATLLVGYDGADEALELLELVPGSLTGTVQAGTEDELAREAVEVFAERVGRVIWNEWPTGVTVSDAQQHGGPWPATTAPTATSVGTAAVERFARPVAYQNVPEAVLPAQVR